ncbi:MAG: hypothetical protein ACRD07_03050 [Acidimicrobiales bacterium]
MSILRGSRRPSHPDSWIFGPKRSVRDLTERTPKARLAAVVAIAVIVPAVSAVALAGGGDEGDDVAGAGVPEGTTLTSSGSIRVTEDGVVVDARDVTGSIYVLADDVTIRRTRVTTSGYHAIRLAGGHRGLVVEDSSLECSSDVKGRSGVAWGNYDAARVEVSAECRRGFVYNRNSSITDSYWGGKPFPDVVPEPTGGRRQPPSSSTPSTAPPATEVTPTTAPPATAAPSDTPTTTPAARPTSNDFPTAATTGVPAGTTLKPSGRIRVTRSGQVIEGLDITGSVAIEAPDVTIRNTRITTTGGGMGVEIMSGGSVVIEDSEIIGGSDDCDNGVGYSRYVLRRVDISGCHDGVKANGGSVEIYDSFIHDTRKTDESHNDGIQSLGVDGLIIEGNTVCGHYQHSTSAIKLAPEKAPVNNVTLRNNFLYGGNYTVYISDHPNSPNLGAPTNLLFQDNVIDPTSYKWRAMTRDSHPTQRIVGTVEATAQEVFGLNPCD